MLKCRDLPLHVFDIGLVSTWITQIIKGELLHPEMDISGIIYKKSIYWPEWFLWNCLFTLDNLNEKSEKLHGVSGLVSSF